MKLKWYDILGLTTPLVLTGFWVWVYALAGINGWYYHKLEMNNYGEWLPETIFISIFFVWGLISYLRLWKIWDGQ